MIRSESEPQQARAEASHASTLWLLATTPVKIIAQQTAPSSKGQTTLATDHLIHSRKPQTDNQMNQLLSPRSKWPMEAILNFLRDTRSPMRISSLSKKGYPQITSLWFVLENEKFFCCTQPHSVVCKQIAENPKVGFEVAVNEPPYFGISGRGNARLVSGDASDMLTALTERYLEGRDAKLKNWLLSRADTEVIIELTPLQITSWDFRKRMTAPSRQT
jgi:nitroimidazol reductase NimA-like FMN-containing flavoprotein (pyridoxamine 5'-phosphate oxidase superfamily)